MPRNYYVLVTDTYSEKHNKRLKKGIYNEWKNQFEYVQGAKGIKVNKDWKGCDTLEEAEEFYQANYHPSFMVIKAPVTFSFSSETGAKFTGLDGKPVQVKLMFDMPYFFVAKSVGNYFEDSNIKLETDGKIVTSIRLLKHDLLENTLRELKQKYSNFFVQGKLKQGYERCHIISKAVLRKFIKRMFEGQPLEWVCQHFRLKDVLLKEIAAKIYQLYQNLINDIDNIFIGKSSENNAQGAITSLLGNYVDLSEEDFLGLGELKESLSINLSQHMKKNWPLMFKLPSNYQPNNTFEKSEFYKPASSFKAIISGYYNANFSIPASGFEAVKVKLLLAFYDKIFRFCYVARDFVYPLSDGTDLKRKKQEEHEINTNVPSFAANAGPTAKKAKFTQLNSANFSKQDSTDQEEKNTDKDEIDYDDGKSEIVTVDVSFAEAISRITEVIPEDLQATKPAASNLNSQSAMNISSVPSQVKQGSRILRL
jgi:hypothetical protein